MVAALLFRSLLVVTLIGLSVTTVGAQTIEPPTIEFERYELPNGLDVILHEDHSTPIAAVNLWYHVGSKNEVVGRTGFAHLFEHMMFQGSENHDADFFEVLDRIGATDRNGTTNFDRTNYFENVPTNALERTLWLEADRMGFLLPAMTQDRLDNQIEVVKNERRQGVDNQPYGTVDERMYEVLYPANHPYRWDVIGYMEDLTASTMEDVQDFFKSYYGPNNCTLVVAGDIDPAQVKNLIEKYFGSIPPGPPVYRQDKWVPELTNEVRLTLEDRVPLDRMYMSWHVPGTLQDDEAELDVLAGILTNGKNSRLYKKLVYELDMAQDVRAYVDDRELSSLFTVRVTAKPGHQLADIEAIVVDEIEALRSKKPTPIEVERTRTGILANFVRGLQRIGGFGGKSDRLARYNTYVGDPGFVDQDFARYQGVTPAGVTAAAKRWLHAGRAVMHVTAFPELMATEVAGLDRSIQPELDAPPALKLPAVQQATLSNGIRVMLAESHKTPVVQVQLHVGGGYSADDKTSLGLASFMSRVQDEGTATRTALEINSSAQELGARLSTNAAVDNFGVTVNALKARLAGSLDLWADVAVSPSFPQEEIDFQRKQVLGQIMQEKRQPVPMALRILPGLLFGKDHPYGQPLTGSGTVASVEQFTREQLVEFHRTWFRPSNATVIVAGDVTMDEIVPELERALSQWEDAPVPDINLAQVELPTATTVFLIDKPEAAQSVLIGGHLLPPKNDPRTVPFEVLNTVLGGQFTSRINMNLREEKGYSYGAFSFPSLARGQGAVLTFTQVRTVVTKESIFEVMKEVRDIQGPRPVTAEELAKVQANMTLELPGSYESIGAIAGMLSEIVTFDLPLDYHSQFPNVVHAQTVEGLTTLANEMFHPDQFVLVVVGDRKVIEPGIRELNLGEIRYLDADGNEIEEPARASR